MKTCSLVKDRVCIQIQGFSYLRSISFAFAFHSLSPTARERKSEPTISNASGITGTAPNRHVHEATASSSRYSDRHYGHNLTKCREDTSLAPSSNVLNNNSTNYQYLFPSDQPYHSLGKSFIVQQTCYMTGPWTIQSKRSGCWRSSWQTVYKTLQSASSRPSLQMIVKISRRFLTFGAMQQTRSTSLSTGCAPLSPKIQRWRFNICAGFLSKSRIRILQ